MSNSVTDRLIDALKKELTKCKYIDVSPGAENFLHVSRGRLDSALNRLINEGYSVITLKERGSHQPPFRILCSAENNWLRNILRQRKIITRKEDE